MIFWPFRLKAVCSRSNCPNYSYLFCCPQQKDFDIAAVTHRERDYWTLAANSNDKVLNCIGSLSCCSGPSGNNYREGGQNHKWYPNYKAVLPEWTFMVSIDECINHNYKRITDMLTIVVIIAFFMSGSCLVLLTSYESCNKGTFHCAQRTAGTTENCLTKAGKFYILLLLCHSVAD